MTPEEFVKGFYLLRKQLIEIYFEGNTKTDVGELIESLNLSIEQTEILKNIMSSSLRDALYTVLLGLDGEASIGDKQETYKLLDEANNELTGGEIERFAWEYFHNKD